MTAIFALLQFSYLLPKIMRQQNEKPPHLGDIARIFFLNQEFVIKWNGRDGPIPRPPRVPDIAPLDFDLFHDLSKDKVYSS